MLGLTPPVRLAFVGDPQRFGAWAHRAPANGVEPLVAARRARGDLEAFAPHVVVVFDVDAVPPSSTPGSARRCSVSPPRDEEGFDAAASAAPCREPPLTRPAHAAARSVAALPPAARRPTRAWDRLVALDPAAAARPRVVAPHRPARRRRAVRPAAPQRAPRAGDVRRRRRPPTASGCCSTPSTARPAPRRARPHARGARRRHRRRGRPARRARTPASSTRVALHAAAGHLVICDHAGHGLEAGTDVLLASDPRRSPTRSAPSAPHPTSTTASASAGASRPSASAPPASGAALVADLQADLDAFG